MTTLKTVCFKKTVLATLVGLCLSQSVFALQEISDDALSQATGEGIALLPENFSFRFNGADNTNNGAGTYGAGSIRLIPVGPLSATAVAKGYKKADAWLYGLSLSQSNKNLGAAIDGSDWGTQYGRPIDSWGTADNPWVISTLNDQNVPNFAGTISNVTYLSLEAPLRKMVLPAAGTSESSAYNLKLGMWTDIFQRDAAVSESGLTGLSNRLRLAAVWDGFSINGSNLKVFQTLDGVTPSMGGTYNATLKINNVPTVKTFNYGMNTNYNRTFGLAGLVRLNSGATDSKRGTIANQTVTREIVQVNYNPATNTFSEGTVLASATGNMATATASATNNTNGIQISYMPMTNDGLDPYKKFYSGSFPSGGVCTTPESNTSGGDGQFGQCLNQNGFTTRRLRAKGTNDWIAPTTTSVFRVSTQELNGGTYDSSTPALGGGVPNFQPNTNADGIFLYDVNVNLVLGNLYQPLMLSTDGNNFSVELARIPNQKEVYQRIYTRYENIDPSSSVDVGVNYMGSTCNIYQCGSSNITGYQGSSATHSSITIGATEYDAATNKLNAHKGVGSYGVSIGELKSGTGLQSATQEDFTQVWVRSRGTVGCGFSTCWGQWGGWSAVNPKTPLSGQPHPSLNRPDPYETTWRQNYNNQILGIQTTTPTNIADKLNGMQPTGATVNNNFGSAVIDGLLIQHLKLTTTGL